MKRITKYLAALLLSALIAATFAGCDLLGNLGGDGDEDYEFTQKTMPTSTQWQSVGRTSAPDIFGSLSHIGTVTDSANNYVAVYFKEGTDAKFDTIANAAYAIAALDYLGKSAAIGSLMDDDEFFGYYASGNDLYELSILFYNGVKGTIDGFYLPENVIKVEFKLFTEDYNQTGSQKMLSGYRLPQGNFSLSWSYAVTTTQTVTFDYKLIRYNEDIYLAHTAASVVMEKFYDYLDEDSYKVYERNSLYNTWSAGSAKTAEGATSDFNSNSAYFMEDNPGAMYTAAGTESISVGSANIVCKKYTGTLSGTSFAYWYHPDYDFLMKLTATSSSNSISYVCTEFKTSGVTGFGSVILPA